jgi:hypothetical protein
VHAHGVRDTAEVLGVLAAHPGVWQLSEWIDGAFGGLGTQPDVGMRLPATFAEAGLDPCLDLDSEVAIAIGEEAVSEAVDYARSLLPRIVAGGVATEKEVDIDTLAERLRADTGPVGRISLWPTIIGAYATSHSSATTRANDRAP